MRSCILLTVVISALALAGPVGAGPWEDAVAADNWGDYATELRLLLPLARQGNMGAQFNLGIMYNLGQGITLDDRQAARWYWLAAQQGHIKAQANLGAMYANGNGVPQDYVLAHMWSNLATAGGNSMARTNRDLDAEKMTRDQIAQAQQLAREWKPTLPK